MAAFRLRARPRPCVAVAAVAAVAAAAAAFAAPSAAEQPRRSSVLASLGGLGAMGWAGWLGSEMKPSTEGQYEEAVVGLGLGAPDVEDASGWELIFFQKTLEDIGHRCPRNSQVLYHYTDLPSCNAIVKGRRGLRLSRGGYKGDLVRGDRLWCKSWWRSLLFKAQPYAGSACEQQALEGDLPQLAHGAAALELWGSPGQGPGGQGGCCAGLLCALQHVGGSGCGRAQRHCLHFAGEVRDLRRGVLRLSQHPESLSLGWLRKGDELTS
ncbi:unnamed protein product [Durusdinium trenchii]|uniref:Uncharacterized protein n=1 Tax=Durusdinium trenchii TaxID=1381693 RepID=A0ABP0I3E7_9DINO